MTLRIKTIFAAGVLALAHSSSFAVYKCTTASGALTYQDSPCTNGERIELKPNDIGSGQQPRARPRLTAPTPRTLDLKPSRLPRIGSSWGDAISTMGRQPDKENSRQSAYAASHQLVYDYDDGRVYIHIRNGIVESVSEYDR
jgi:hypothetical protein